jgi:hypothetical protein
MEKNLRIQRGRSVKEIARKEDKRRMMLSTLVDNIWIITDIYDWNQ